MSFPHGALAMTDSTSLLDRLASRDATVAVLGQGYVGLVLAMRASEAGFTVVGVEPDASRAASLAKGSSYVDDVPADVLQAALDRGYRTVSTVEEIPPFDVAVIAVPTPLHEGRPDLGALGVDLRVAIDAAATKPFGFMPFRPGPGVGGHCLPVDPSYLSWRVARELGAPFRFVELANEVNARMPAYVVQRLQELLNRDGLALNGARVLVLGLSYKPGTGDTREAPSAPIIATMRRLGAEVRAVDPHVDPSIASVDVPLVALTEEAIDDADAVLVLTDHPDFDLEMVARRARRILDTRGCIAPGASAAAEHL